MDGYSLRPATLDDIPQILNIETHVHRAPWTEGHFQEELDKSQSNLWVMTDDETDEKVVGYIVFSMLFENGEILNVAVDHDFQRRGVARFMLRKVIAELMRGGIKKLNLDVRKSNLSAVALYQSLGFTIGQVRKSFYSDGEDGYFMSLPLEEDGVRF